ncbi:hypothetical protein [Nocardia sp. NPDC050718]|uniref:hypothetical protein n=1 Tax=Nocardia sp. NPDC050718 TaxID=3155788 RepID=UPI0033EBF8C0
MSTSAASRDHARLADRLGGTAIGFLAVALVAFVWVLDQPSVDLPSPAITLGSFTVPAAVAVALSGAGLAMARRAGVRSWLAPVAFRLSVGFVVMLGGGVAIGILMMHRMGDALSSF